MQEEKNPNNSPNLAMSRPLIEAIDRVRKDIAEVEFWACTMTCFTQPVPEYEPKDISVWIPKEQASTLKADKRKS